MTGITERPLERISEAWKRRREKTVKAPHELIPIIGRRAYELNGQSGGRRFVPRLIRDWIDSRIQQSDITNPEADRECRRVVLSLAESALVSTGDNESVQEAEVTAEQFAVELVRRESVSTDS